MRIDTVVHPGSSQKKVLIKENVFHVYIHSQPEKGKANTECIETLSKHFKIKKSAIRIISGDTSRKKVIEVDDSTGHITKQLTIP